MSNSNTYAIDWENIDLDDNYQAGRNLLENYTFDTLLLEVNCNLPTISEKTVKAQAMEVINAKYREAIELLEANLTNITNKAIKDREQD
jgi:hypothetical protein